MQNNTYNPDLTPGDLASHEDYAALLKERDALAVENAGTNSRMQQLIQIINNADNSYCMCGEEMEKHTYAGCGHPAGMFDYHYNKWLESSNETPAAGAAIASIQAQGVDRFADHLSGLKIMASETSAREFAAQLRKES